METPEKTQLSIPLLQDSFNDQMEPVVAEAASCDHRPLTKMKRLNWWLLVAGSMICLLAGQAAAVLLGRFYYDKGGNSKWMATLVQTAAFPFIFIIYLLIPSSEKQSGTSNSPSLLIVIVVYLILGVVIAGDNMLYSVGLLYLSASTYSLICAMQLAFSAIFSYLINGQKFTVLISISGVVLTISALLLAANDTSDEPSGVSRGKYVLGILTTLGASALYSLLLSLMQFSFEKVLKKETCSVVLDMQIYTSLVATSVSIVGLFASGEWRTLAGEMDRFQTGNVSYAMTLACTALAWQICSLGVVGLIFVVSSLFSNAISTVSLAVTPIVSIIIFHDKSNGVKILAILLSLCGLAIYIYQNYLDDQEVRSKKNIDTGNDSSC